MADISDVTRNGESLSKVQKLWREVKEWRIHWRWSRFLYVLVIGLAFALFDSVTDFNFARSVSQDCRNTTDSSPKPFDKVYVSSPCGLLYYKNVERLTYTYIAYPGFFLTLDGLRSLVWGLVTKCTKGKEVNGMFTKLGSFFAVALEVSLAVGLLVAAMWSDRWEKHLPEVAVGYDIVIQGMSYLSFAMVVGVKFLGLISHGPETYSLYHKATVNETIFESSLQLSLVARIFFSSGYGTQASLLSAVSSFAAIGKVQVQTFLRRHHEQLSNASIMGKIFVAASILPVFVLSDIFKLGWSTLLLLWSDITAVNILLGIGLPVLGFYVIGNLMKDMKVPNIQRGVLCQMLVFYLWPRTGHGRRIGLVMTFFIFLLYLAWVPFVIANPETQNTGQWTTTDPNNTDYNSWMSETGWRLWVASVFFLFVGILAFVLTILIVLFEDKLVASIVAKFPKQPKEKEEEKKEEEEEKDKDTKETSNYENDNRIELTDENSICLDLHESPKCRQELLLLLENKEL